jgi:peptide/nickel transport system permease protein
VQGWEYKLLGLIPSKLHLFGVEEGGTIYVLGTDKLGRDLFGKSCEAGRVSLSMSLFGTIISIAVGSVVGITSGYYGGNIDTAMQRLWSFVNAFPQLPCGWRWRRWCPKRWIHSQCL